MMLDLDSVRLFVLVAQYRNLTRAAEAAGTVQPVVSQRLKALEQMLGRKLLDRSPRMVRLTEAGAQFLQRAHDLLAAHDAAISADSPVRETISIGISDHALGTTFDTMLSAISLAVGAKASISVHLGQSSAIRELYEKGEVHLALLRRESAGADGEVLGEDPLGWWVGQKETFRQNEVPLALLAAPCGVRTIAVQTLERNGMPWREAFVGGSCLSVVAAVRAGLGIAPLGRMASAGLIECGEEYGLPALPPSQIVLLARTSSAQASAAARVLAASVRQNLMAPAIR